MKHVHHFRRQLLVAAVALAAAPVAFAQPAPVVEVWKTASCGCCKDWIRHMESNGFRINAHDVDSTAEVRSRLGLPEAYSSCHTASIGGYALEGHVPAKEVKRLLREKPAAVGLAVPGMTIGSPGMDTPAYGGRKDPYDVMLVGRDGKARVYQSYR